MTADAATPGIQSEPPPAQNPSGNSSQMPALPEQISVEDHLKLQKKLDEVLADNKKYRDERRSVDERERLAREAELKNAQDNAQWQKAAEILGMDNSQLRETSGKLESELNTLKQRAMLAEEYEKRANSRVVETVKSLDETTKKELMILYPEWDAMNPTIKEDRLSAFLSIKNSQKPTIPGGYGGQRGNPGAQKLEDAWKSNDSAQLVRALFS